MLMEQKKYHSVHFVLGVGDDPLQVKEPNPPKDSLESGLVNTA